MARPKKPIRRDDGTVYESISAAAKAIVAEQGVGDWRQMTGNISYAAKMSKWGRKAYGHGWEMVDDG